jgi:hypothetical protein
MEFCDLNCEYAAWPKEKDLDGSGSCRTFQAIYCTQKKQHVHKNMPCADKKKKTSPVPVAEETPSS